MLVRRRANSFRPAEMIGISTDSPSPEIVRSVAGKIRQGAVVAIPTDTVYGLAANPFNERAVQEIFRAKRRPETLPILLLIDSMSRVEELTDGTPEDFRRLARRFWPGPLTMVLPAASHVPQAVTAGTGTIAVRLPDSGWVRSLAGEARVPLTGTSANLSGRRTCTSAEDVNRQLGTSVPYIVNGGVARVRCPSTIVDLTAEPQILREGAIPGNTVLDSL